MASNALGSLDYNIVDVDRLIASHGELHDGNRGRKGLGHITRSGVVMLCASWELYVEMLLQEAANFLAGAVLLATDLPTEVQKQLSAVVKSDKNELGPIKLAGDGWKSVFCQHVTSRAESLNTPKSGKLIPLFLQLLGVDDISRAWSTGVQPLDDFVSVRGDIAHRGRHAQYVPIGKLQEYREQIRQYAVETDDFLAEHLKSITPARKKPWRASRENG